MGRRRALVASSNTNTLSVGEEVQIQNTNTPDVFRLERYWGDLGIIPAYSLPVPHNHVVTVSLYFCENYWSLAQERVFSIRLQVLFVNTSHARSIYVTLSASCMCIRFFAVSLRHTDCVVCGCLSAVF